MPNELKIALYIYSGILIWLSIGGVCRGILEGVDGDISDDFLAFGAIVAWPITTLFMGAIFGLMLAKSATSFVRSFFK